MEENPTDTGSVPTSDAPTFAAPATVRCEACGMDVRADAQHTITFFLPTGKVVTCLGLIADLLLRMRAARFEPAQPAAAEAASEG